VSNPQKTKGDKAELEVQELLRLLFDDPYIRRALGAGRQDDMGDIEGIPGTAIQVANWANKTAAIRSKLVGVERQRLNKRVPFAASFIRLQGGTWIVVMTPEQWHRMWKYAIIGWRIERTKWCSQCGRRRHIKYFYNSQTEPDGVSVECSDCRSKSVGERNRRQRREFLQTMGGKCKLCGNRDFRVLQIDHVHGDGHLEPRSSSLKFYAKVLANPDDYQILCANCNMIKKAVNREVHTGRRPGTKAPTQRKLTDRAALMDVRKHGLP
jgi:hypothetical protein